MHIFALSLSFAGTYFGHPVSTGIVHAPTHVVTFAEAPVHTLTADRCNGTFETFEVAEVIDLLAGDAITLPEGSICGVRLDLAGRMHVQGESSGGSGQGTFSLSLAVGQVFLDVDPALTVSGGTSAATQIRFADSTWLASIPLTPGSHLHVNPAHPQHDALRNVVRHDSVIVQ